MNRDAVIVCGVALVVFALTGWLHFTMYRRWKTWVPACGTVIRLGMEDDGARDAVISYATGAGEAKEIRGWLASTTELGAEVGVLHCPKSGAAMIDFPNQRAVPMVIGYFIGCTCLVFVLCYSNM